MPVPEKLTAHFEEQCFYHVICKCIDGRKLFLDDNDREFFLKRYQELMEPFINTYSYCLLDNHAHFLIETKNPEDINPYLMQIPKCRLTLTHIKFLRTANQEKLYHELIKQQFNRLFISHTMSFNRKHQQKGHLFIRPFRRMLINEDAYLTHVVIYIHANPLKHGITDDFTHYKWSSCQALLSDGFTRLKRKEVLDWFGGREMFEKTQSEQAEYYFAHPVL